MLLIILEICEKVFSVMIISKIVRARDKTIITASIKLNVSFKYSYY